MKADFNRSLMPLDVPVSGMESMVFSSANYRRFARQVQIVKDAYIKYPGRQKAMLGEIP
jgi:hypothetical protein